MLNILYIGPNYSEWGQEHCPCSLAAAKWARGFLSALSKVANVTALTHTYFIPWPKGDKIWCGHDDRFYPKGWDCETVSYPVLKYVREWWWAWMYPRKARHIIQEKNIDVVLFYNCEYPHERAMIRRIAKFGVPCVPIILDGDDPRRDNWGWLKETALNSIGFITLSWWVHRNIPANTGKPSYHFDGGADGWRGNCIESGVGREEKRLVHTGALDQWRGLDFMVDVVKRMTARRKDVKFIFCGKSSEKVLKEVFNGNPQVELPGFVSEEEMASICNCADVLLNVRDPNHPDNILNYPSKLPHYLSFGQPVVSTRLQSLSPDYDEVVNFADGDAVESYIKKVEEVLLWDAQRKAEEYHKIKDWFERRKSWDVMVKGLVDWLEDMVK